MFLEHVNLSVSSLEHSIDFYRRALGLRLRWRGTTRTGQEAAHVGGEVSYLALFQAGPSAASPVSADYLDVGINHFGLVVDDLDRARERLEFAGVRPHHETNEPPGRRLYFFDPDGIEVELASYPETHGGAP